MSLATGTAAPGSITRRTTSAATYTLASHLATQLIRLASNLVTSRLLSPSDYGVFALAFTSLTAINLFTDLGVRLKVINRSDLDQNFINTAWSMQIIRGTVISAAVMIIGLILLGAQNLNFLPTESAYSNSDLPWIIIALALAALIQGADPIRAWIAQRDLVVGRLLVLEIGAQVAMSLATVIFCLIFHSVWSLLAGTLFGMTARLAVLYWLLPGQRERFRVEPTHQHAILKDSHWIVSSSIIGFFVLQGDRVVLGGLFTEHDFGLYIVSITLTATVQTAIGKLASNVLYPVLAEVKRNSHSDLLKTISRAQRTFDICVASVAVAAAHLATPIISTLYDSRYQDAGKMLCILTIGLISMRCQIIEQLYFISGHANFATKCRLAQLMAILTLPLAGNVLYGPLGAIAGITISQFVGIPFAIYYTHREGLHSWAAHSGLIPGVALGMVIGVGGQKILNLF